MLAPVPSGQVRTLDGRLQPRPAWADSASSDMKDAHETFQSLEFGVQKRTEFDGDILKVVVVERDSDLIFQIFPKTSAFPKDQALARVFLANAIETYFGSTDDFEGGYTPEVESWAIKAKGIKNLVSFREDYHVNGFVQLLSDALADLQE